MAPRALALLALPLLVATRAVALAPTPLAPLSPLEVKRLQVFSAFDDGETRLAMRLIEAAAMEEAETPGGLADSATGAFAASLARLRRRAFPGAADGPWRDGELAAWPWTAPLAAARCAAAAELGAVAAARWDAAEYEAIARDWAFLPLWQRGVWKSNLQPDFDVRIFECFDTRTFAVLRALDESNRFVQKSAESTSI
jgi:hypothetical protein